MDEWNGMQPTQNVVLFIKKKKGGAGGFKESGGFGLDWRCCSCFIFFKVFRGAERNRLKLLQMKETAT
jgi:hypothetical protein